MHILESDRQGISQYCIDQLQRHEIQLKETARQILIAKAMKAYRETDGNYPYMQAIVESEISLMTALNRTSDRVVDICGNIASQAIVERLTGYFANQGINLHHDNAGYYARIPKSFDLTEMRKKIKKILDNQDW